MFSLRLCYCSHLTDTTIIITITACSTQLLAFLLTTATVVITSNFTQGWMNFNWLLHALTFPFIYARLQPAERCQSRRFMISTTRELFCERLCMCILILVCPTWLLVYLEGVRRISLCFCCVYVFYLFYYISNLLYLDF